mmetsp:Transcript_55736/g.156976  ORF Transcript_55736/g.156976 Transcript_55736/m.156976 type:complete len:207 (-) Transcript_55736:222-842(-)
MHQVRDQGADFDVLLRDGRRERPLRLLAGRLLRRGPAGALDPLLPVRERRHHDLLHALPQALHDRGERLLDDQGDGGPEDPDEHAVDGGRLDAKHCCSQNCGPGHALVKPDLDIKRTRQGDNGLDDREHRAADAAEPLGVRGRHRAAPGYVPQVLQHLGEALGGGERRAIQQVRVLVDVLVRIQKVCDSCRQVGVERMVDVMARIE